MLMLMLMLMLQILDHLEARKVRPNLPSLPRSVRGPWRFDGAGEDIAFSWRWGLPRCSRT